MKHLFLVLASMMWIAVSAQESLQATLDDFVNDMSAASLTPEMSKYVSDVLCSSYSDEQIKDLSVKHPYSKALKELNSGDKKLGKVLTLTSTLYHRAKNQRTISVKNIGNPDAGEVTVVLALGQYEKSTLWKKNDNGQWQLVSTDILDDERLDVYDGVTKFEKYIDRSYEFGMIVPMTKMATMGVSFSWYYYATTMMWGGSTELGKFKCTNKDDEEEIRGCLNLMATIGWQKQLMLKNKSLLYPYVKGYYGMSFPYAFIFGGAPGVRYGWRSRKGNIFFLFSECDLRYFKELSKSNEGIGNHMTAGLKLGVGFGLR